MKYLKRREKHTPLWAVALLDVVLAGIILLAFAFFHHVLPMIKAKQQLQEKPVATIQTTQPAEIETTLPVETESVETAEATTAATTEPDNRTEWQIKFAEHFTDEVVITDHSYTSPNVSITIDAVVTGEGSEKITYYVADIYIASLDNFKTYTPHGQMKYFDTQPALEMMTESNAIFAISGDFLTYQSNGFLVRNGEVYISDRNFSNCVLFQDGTMETNDRGSYQIQDILDRDPLQVWSFGPVLLDENGQVRDKYTVSEAVGYPNPRSAIGYYEPGHYCMVVVDGRKEGHSAGMRIPQLAQIFVDLGCTTAYNLDGGGTAVMLFNGKTYSVQSNGGRDLGDILLITEEGFTYKEDAQ